MKMLRFSAALLAAPVFFLASCDDKTPPAESGAGGEAPAFTDPVAEDPAPPVATGLSAGERAEMLGFAGHLSADADLFMAIYDGSGMVKSLADLDAWDFIRKVVEQEEGVDPREQIEEGAAQVEGFLGTELFLAFGDGSAEQFKSFNTFSSRISYYQFRMMSAAFARAAASGDLEEGMQAMDDEAWLMDMARDIGDYMPLIESVEVPPVLAGLRITDGEQMKVAEQQIRDFLGMASEGSEPVEFEKGPATFSGNLYKGETLAEGMEGERDEMDEVLGEENADKLLAALRKKQVLACVGRLDDYLLVYFGGSPDACPIADDLSGSLAADAGIGFIDGFKDTPVHGFVHGSGGLMESAVSSGLKQMAEGCRDGIQGIEGFGDTRELVALLNMVGEREQALLDFYEAEPVGAVISIDEGARFDLFGGGQSGATDFESPHRLGSLGDAEDVLLFANWANHPAYEERAGELVELLVEIVYATAGHLSALEVESDDLAQIRGGYQMFDSMFREDLLKLWKGLGAMEAGLGSEGAFLVDLSAEFPPIPGVPAGIVEEGRFPRMSFVAPVEERESLRASWKQIEEAVTAMLATANEMGDLELHMLKPTNSQKDDIVTWYFDALAFSDDVKPSVTVSDDWFVASTSRNQALDLVERAGGGESGRTGLWAKLDLQVLRNYLEESLKVVEKNGDDFMDEGDLDQFREMLPMALEGLAALEQVKAVTVHERMEDGVRRATLHFHVK